MTRRDHLSKCLYTVLPPLGGAKTQKLEKHSYLLEYIPGQMASPFPATQDSYLQIVKL